MPVIATAARVHVHPKYTSRKHPGAARLKVEIGDVDLRDFNDEKIIQLLKEGAGESLAEINEARSINGLVAQDGVVPSLNEVLAESPLLESRQLKTALPHELSILTDEQTENQTGETNRLCLIHLDSLQL